MNKVANLLKFMRIKHYVKNFLIFIPLIFSGNLFISKDFLSCVIGFVTFSLLCSVVYIINDIKDVDKDRLHYKKKGRPLASGIVSIKEAIFLLIILLSIILIIIVLNKFSIMSIIFLFIYFLINLLYSFGLKNVPIIDLVILAFGFVTRVLYGASIINVDVSNWLYLTVITISFYLSLGKRRNEVIINGNTREVLKYYDKVFLDKNMYMFLGMGIVFYSLWTIDANIINNTSKYLVWTVPFVIVIVMRYNMIIDCNSDGDPVEVVFNDKVLLLLMFVYCIVVLFLVYFL